MSDTRAAGIGVTIKYGKGYEETWATFQGASSEIRSQIEEYFGLDGTDLTLNELVINATQTAHGVTTAVRGLGGTTVPASSGSTTASGDEAQADPWAAASEGSSEPQGNAFLPLIEACSNVEELKRLYASQPTLKEDDEALAAWKAKGKSLSGK